MTYQYPYPTRPDRNGGAYPHDVRRDGHTHCTSNVMWPGPYLKCPDQLMPVHIKKNIQLVIFRTVTVILYVPRFNESISIIVRLANTGRRIWSK
jgi:hypothetical protein